MDSLVFCPGCYRKNEADAVQCLFCGAALIPQTAVSQTTAHVHAPGVAESSPSPCASLSAQLPHGGVGLFVFGQSEPIFLEPANGYVLGRRTDPYAINDASQKTDPFSTRDSIYLTSFIDLSLYNAAGLGVSRHHARISFEEDTVYVEDLSSTNGTWLNQARLTPDHSYPLHSNDRLLLGQLVIWVCIDERPLPHAPKKFFLRETVTAAASTVPRLSLAVLAGVIMPYLLALEKVQHVLDQCEERPLREVHFLSLAVMDRSAAPQSLGIATIEAVGLEEALYTVKERITPWRNLHPHLIGCPTKTLTPATKQELAQLAAIILADHNSALPIKHKFPLVEQLVPFLALLVTSKAELFT